MSNPGYGRKKKKKRRGTLDESSSSIKLSPSETDALTSRGYKIQKKLSQGFSSKIYMSSYSGVGSIGSKYGMVLACKVIDKNHISQRFLEKFLPREIAILTDIMNPHCIQTFHIIEANRKCFIFMKYAENGDLQNYLIRHGSPEQKQCRLWIRQMILALKYLQDHKICHRDIKCQNILLTYSLNAKLADFGFARHWVDKDTQEDNLSQTYCGSLSYAAPEILAGKPYSPKYCDIWSLGVVFYVIVNLCKPFTMNKAVKLYQQQLAKDYEFKPRSVYYVNAYGKEIIRKMLEPDVNRRITVREVLDSPWMNEDENLLKRIPE